MNFSKEHYSTANTIKILNTIYQNSSIEDDIMYWREKQLNQTPYTNTSSFFIELIPCEDRENRETNSSRKTIKKENRIIVKKESAETQDHWDCSCQSIKEFSFRNFTQVSPHIDKQKKDRSKSKLLLNPINTKNRGKGKITQIKEGFKRIINQINVTKSS